MVSEFEGMDLHEWIHVSEASHLSYHSAHSSNCKVSCQRPTIHAPSLPVCTVARSPSSQASGLARSRLVL